MTLDTRVHFCKEAIDRIGSLYAWGGDDDDEGGFDCSGLFHDCAIATARYWPEFYDGSRRTAASVYDYFSKRGCKSIWQPAQLAPGCLVFCAANAEAKIHHMRIHLYTAPPLSRCGYVAVEAGGGDSDNTSARQSLMERATISLVASDRPNGRWWVALDPFLLLEA